MKINEYLRQHKEKCLLNKFYIDYGNNTIELYFNYNHNTIKFDLELIINFLIKNDYKINKIYVNEHLEIIGNFEKGYYFIYGNRIEKIRKTNVIIKLDNLHF